MGLSTVDEAAPSEGNIRVWCSLSPKQNTLYNRALCECAGFARDNKLHISQSVAYEYHVLLSIWTSMNQYEPVWTSMTKYDPVWPSMTKYDQVWASMNQWDLGLIS